MLIVEGLNAEEHVARRREELWVENGLCEC